MLGWAQFSFVTGMEVRLHRNEPSSFWEKSFEIMGIVDEYEKIYVWSIVMSLGLLNEMYGLWDYQFMHEWTLIAFINEAL